MSKQQLAWSDCVWTQSDQAAVSVVLSWFDSFEPLQQVQSMSKQQLAWSDCGSTHSSLSEQVHSLSKQQLAWSDRGSTHSNISEPVHSLSKQERVVKSTYQEFGGVAKSTYQESSVWFHQV